MYRYFIKEDLSKYDFSNLKYATIAGGRLNPEEHSTGCDWFKDDGRLRTN